MTPVRAPGRRRPHPVGRPEGQRVPGRAPKRQGTKSLWRQTSRAPSLAVPAGAAGEGGDHGRRGRHPPAAPHRQPAQADAPGRQPADHGAHRPAPPGLRVQGHRGHGPVPGQPGPQLLRRRLRHGRRSGLRHRADPPGHGRQRPQRRRDAGRDLRGHLGGRPHRHRPRRGGQLPPPPRRHGHRGPQADAQPARVRHRHHPEDGRIERFLEKPHWGQVFSDTINTGIYVLEPEVFEHIPDGQPSDFAADVFPELLGQGAPLFGFVADGYWEDVGSLEAYQRAHQDILDGKVKVDLRGFQVRPGVWLGEGTEIDPDAVLTAPVLIGDFTKVEAGARLREYTVVGSGVIVKRDAFLHRAIVHDNAYIGPGTSLRGCVVGRSADVKQGGRVEDGVVVGDNADIGHNAILQPNVKIYPYKTVEPGAIVTKSIIWEGRGARALFDEAGVTGIGNVDLTPEMVLRVATAFGSTLKKGSRVTLGPGRQPGLAGPQAGHHRRAELVRSDLRGPGAGPGPGGAVLGRPDGRLRRHVRAHRPRGQPVGRAGRVRRRRQRRRRGGQAPDRAHLLPGGVPPGVRAGDGRAALPAQGGRALRRRPGPQPGRRGRAPPRLQGGAGRRRRDGLAGPPAPVVQVEPRQPDRERPPRREPGRPHRRRAPGRPRAPGQAGHRLRVRPGGAVRRRRASGSPWSTSAAPSSGSTGRCCCSST